MAVVLTGAVLGAADLLRQRLVKVAAGLLRAGNADQVELMDGVLRLKANHEVQMPLRQVIGTILTRADLLPPDVEPTMEATYVWTAPDRGLPDEQGRAKSYLTAANACHVVVVEVDPDTGKVEILKYFVADDCGTVNPPWSRGPGRYCAGVGAALWRYVCDDSTILTPRSLPDPTIFEVPMSEGRAGYAIAFATGHQDGRRAIARRRQPSPRSMTPLPWACSARCLPV
jgi:CO/xanthine dehydrogenase Mo-binding subunit